MITNTNTYKVGDRVKVIDLGGNSGFTLGKEYTVAEAEPFDTSGLVRLINNNNESQGLYAHRIEPVKVLTDTRAEAYEAAKPKMSALQDRILAAMVESNGDFSIKTADDLAKELDVPLLTVRPAITRLKQKELIKDSGFRGVTALGKNSKAYQRTK